MSVIFIGLLLCLTGFLVSAVLCARSIYAHAKNQTKIILPVAVIATALQLVIAKQALYINNSELTLSLASMSLLVSGLINAVILWRSIKQFNPMMVLVTTAFAAILALLLVVTPTSSALYNSTIITTSLPMLIHIVLSVAAYCVLVIASLYALQFHYIDSKLKAKTLSLNSYLPPLNVVENQHFKLMTLGVLLLTAALVTGFAFLENMWAKDYAHKTILSLIAWVIFVALTLGHKIYGWRGHKSAIITIIGAIILSLGYFGSRFVREIILT